MTSYGINYQDPPLLGTDSTTDGHPLIAGVDGYDVLSPLKWRLTLINRIIGVRRDVSEQFDG